MPTCTHTGRFMSVLFLCLFYYVLDNLNWLVFVFLFNLMVNLICNIIKKLYFNDQHKFRVYKRFR